MALSQIIRTECPTCNKVAVEKSRISIGSSTLISLMCGHMISSKQMKSDIDYSSLLSSDGKLPRPYQIDGIKFLAKANGKAILADEAGLGKTIQVGLFLRLYAESVLPVVCAVPSTIKLQFMWEVLRWCCPNNTEEEKRKFLTQIIMSGKEKAMPGFGIYIVTYDMLKKEDMFDYVTPKTIIIDECQRIKNHLSDRAKAIQRVARRCEYIIPMSGTPIKNNAGEYFTVLNLVKPTTFHNYTRFIEDHCDSYNNGWGYKVGGLKNPAMFHELTKDIIIRRTKAEVLKDLPPIDRKFYHVDLDPKLNKAYAAALQELDDLFYSDESEFGKGSATIAIMQKLRHITGSSKTTECIEFITEFLLSTDRKITIFTHHQDVMDLLNIKLSQWCEAGGFPKPLVLHSGLDSMARARLVETFKNTDSRILIASTLASGEGVNLQFCSDAVMLERQWNPANEEQSEARFHRFGQENPVSITYMIASGTIDEYFTELVETKRSIVASTLDNKEIAWDQSSLMKELTGILLTKGRDRWRL